MGAGQCLSDIWEVTAILLITDHDGKFMDVVQVLTLVHCQSGSAHGLTVDFSPHRHDWTLSSGQDGHSPWK